MCFSCFVFAVVVCVVFLGIFHNGFGGRFYVCGIWEIFIVLFLRFFVVCSLALSGKTG